MPPLLASRLPRAVFPSLGFVVVFAGLTQLVPLGVAFFEDGSDLRAFMSSAALSVAIGLGVLALYGRRRADLRHRDAIVVVVASWLVMSVLCALPYAFTGTLGPLDALFESISGLTTTGASVIADVESLPAGLLFWRSLTHWIGGMGILLLAVAILPLLGSATYPLLRTESPSLGEERIYPRLAETARALFGIYVLLTAAQTALLLLGGMSLFDALAHSFASVATGGFSTKSASVGAYGSLYIEIVCILFMFFGSLPFGVHFRGLRSPRAYLESTQTRVHTTILLFASLTVAVDLWAKGVYAGLGESVRHATFQVTTLMTTTGFATANSETWTPYARIVLVAVMFLGGCTGSTSGGIKTYRFVVLSKVVRRNLLHLRHPTAVRPIRIGHQSIDERAVTSAGVFFLLHLGVAGLGTVALMAFGTDLGTAFTAAAATLGGVGPGLGDVGPYDNYAWMPDGAKAVCIGLMLLGRLEITICGILFLPEFWRTG
jgi:trk system potassium uptake protein TrkH